MEVDIIVKRSTGMKIIRKANLRSKGLLSQGYIRKGELVRVEQQRWFLRLARD